MRNARTEFGRRYEFSSIRDVDAYRDRLPVRGYSGFASDIRRIADGAPNVLTAEPVIAFEETGGTSAGAKLIPYTANGLAAFRRGVLPWLSDLSRARPGAAIGSAYWAISPAGRPSRRTSGGIPIGLESDAAYFGSDLAPAFLAVSAVPPAAGMVRDMATWQYLTLRCLLDRDDLTFVSVWNPSFFSILADSIAIHADTLARSLRDGVVGVKASHGWTAVFHPRPERSRLLEKAISGQSPDLAALWPGLDTVSCWTDGTAGPAAGRLAAMLPQAWMQGKGLLATEGMVTLPLAEYRHPVPALTSTFLEFIDSRGASRLVHELVEGECYRTVITTESGLYRYDLGDRVLCCGVKARVPMLRFLGRADNVSDLVGEKLDESFVTASLAGLTGFATLVAIGGAAPRYVAVVDEHENVSALARVIDKRLCANPQYAYARQLGQLAPVRAMFVAGAERKYFEWQVRQGRRFGDVKPPALMRDCAVARAIWFEPGVPRIAGADVVSPLSQAKGATSCPSLFVR